MAPSATELFTREEVLTGLPARHAHTALFLIESRTAHWVAQARQVLEPFLGETTAAERDLAFVEAFAQGKAPPVRPAIHDLERYAASWRNLAPDSPRARAALAQLLGQKYRFTAAAVPGIRSALGLDEPAVQAAYEKLYGQPLTTIYAAQPTLLEWLRWGSARLSRSIENLPPFWSVFVLTFTQTVGATVLALPIALAGIGPIAGIVLLTVFGLINILTIAAQAEATARSGEMRYGTAFLGRLVESYLGRTGAGIVAVAIAADCIVTLLAFYSGFGSSLADATGLPAGLWAAALFLVILYFLRRESLSATITSSIVIGAINLAVLAIIAGLAFTRSDPENLTYMNVPLLNGQPFDPAILQVIFGIVLGAYFGHLSVGNYARLALSRDPSARSLIWGAAAALAAGILLYSVWVLAVNGAVPPAIMAAETGTALGPLALAVGPAVDVLGAIYVILAIAIVSVHFSLSLYNLMRERLPRYSEPVIWLPRRHGRLILRGRAGRAGNTVSVTYLGLSLGRGSPQPQFRIDSQQGESVQRVEITQGDRWDESTLRSHWPQLDRHVRLAVTVQAATQEGARVQVATPMVLRYEGEWDSAGLHMADLLALPDETISVLVWLMRRGGATAAEVAAHAGQDVAIASQMLGDLVEQGLLMEGPGAKTRSGGEGSGPRYLPQFAHRRSGNLPGTVWQALEREPADASAKGVSDGGRRLTQNDGIALSGPRLLARLGPGSRFWLAASPIAMIFLVTEILLWTGNASFVGILSFLGTVIDSCLAGLFPVLLLYASRRKGEFVPGKVYSVLGQPWLLGGIYLLFIAAILVHGLVIWQNPIQRACAVLVGLFMLVATAILIRNGAFDGRVVVEICADPRRGPVKARNGEGQGRFAVTARGKPALAEVRPVYSATEGRYSASAGDLPSFDDLCEVTFDLPETAARDLKVWAHRVTPDGQSESLPVLAEMRCGDVIHKADLRLSGGQALLPWAGPACRLTLRFDRADETGRGQKVAVAAL